MALLRTLRRPSVLVSLLVHGGVVAAAAHALDRPRAPAPVPVLGFVSESWAGPEDVPAEEPTPLSARETEAVHAEPPAPETALPEELPLDLEANADAAGTLPTPFDRVPTERRTRPRNAPPLPAVPAPVPAASAPPPPVAAASRAGSGLDRDAVRTENRKPPYPMEAFRRGWEGTVRLLVLVAPDGTVGEVSVANSSGFDVLDRAALEAARAWRYEPRLVAGEPAPDRLLVPVTFRIR